MPLRPVVNRRTDCAAGTRHLRRYGFGPAAWPDQPWVEGRSYPACVPDRILCWVCRECHHPDLVLTCMALSKPVAASPNGSTSSLTAKIPPWLSQFPELWEFLSKPSYRDGTPRQLGKVSLGLASDGVQVTLTDPSSCAYCSRVYSSLEDALLALEVGLSEGSLTWRASGPQRGKKRP